VTVSESLFPIPYSLFPIPRFLFRDVQNRRWKLSPPLGERVMCKEPVHGVRFASWAIWDGACRRRSGTHQLGLDAGVAAPIRIGSVMAERLDPGWSGWHPHHRREGGAGVQPTRCRGGTAHLAHIPPTRFFGQRASLLRRTPFVTCDPRLRCGAGTIAVGVRVSASGKVGAGFPKRSTTNQ